MHRCNPHILRPINPRTLDSGANKVFSVFSLGASRENHSFLPFAAPLPASTARLYEQKQLNRAEYGFVDLRAPRNACRRNFHGRYLSVPSEAACVLMLSGPSSSHRTINSDDKHSILTGNLMDSGLFWHRSWGSVLHGTAGSFTLPMSCTRQPKFASWWCTR